MTLWSIDTRVLFAFRNASGIEAIFTVLENIDWKDLHIPAFEVLINVVDNPVLCEYIQQSGCLWRLISFLDKSVDKPSIEKVLGVLARMTQMHIGRQVGQVFLQTDSSTQSRVPHILIFFPFSISVIHIC